MVGSSNTALTTTLVNSSTLRAEIPAISSGTYPVYVVNTNGGTGIRINGLTTSSFPAWSTGATLSNQFANTSFGVSLSANSDSNITYSNTSVLPAGTSLLANGYFLGTVTIGVQTTYNFTVKANDAENQDASRTFSITVTLPPPPPGLWSWGQNQEGQLGFSDIVYRSSPVQVGTNANWRLISNGWYTNAAIKTDGTLWAWGRNSRGQLGLGNAVSRSSPTQVGTDTTWNLVNCCSRYNAAAIKTNGTLWTWGGNLKGQLGLNDRVYRSSPVQVGALTNWSQVSTGKDIFVFIKTDGTLWTLGDNSRGQLGRNDRVYRSSPIQVGVATNWSKISAAFADGEGVTATKTDGTLWSWGQAIVSGDFRSSPTQIGSGTNWNQISGGTENVMATKTDGTLWGWGLNLYGQLGQNDKAYKNSPTQVGTGTNWSKISSGRWFATAIKTDGTLWAWGIGHLGQLGSNNKVYRSSPIQVGVATNWSNVSSGMASTIAITI
jgi:alpha-tubulin suppressor-like RCC1 family protein